jgi:hypothetical protein
MIFEDTKRGLFQVLATVMSSNHNTVYVHLWQNENRLVALYANVGYNEATANIVLNLKKNDITKQTNKQTNNCPIGSFFI